MRRGVLVIVALLILSGVIIFVPKDVESVGQPQFTMIMMTGYQGYKADDPVDVSTGFIGYDSFNSPTTEVIVVIHGGVEVSTSVPIMNQDIIVNIEHYIETSYGDIGVDFSIDPEEIVFTDIMPGENQRIDYNLSLVINKSVPAGENSLWIGGRWHYEPGIGGGSISYGGGPFHIAPVVSAGFVDPFSSFFIGSNEMDSIDVEIVNNGNVREPELDIEIKGLESESESDIYISYTLDILMEYFSIRVFSGDVEPYDEWDIEVILVDVENDTELDSFEFTLQITDGPPIGDDDDDEPPVGDDDDDEPPIGDDDDEEPVELLSTSQCRRTYNDASGDDLYFWASGDESGVEQGEHPEVDITNVNVNRDDEDLVVVITMSDLIWEYSTFDVYILPDGDHEQPKLDTNPYDTGDFPDYMPDEAIASSDIMSRGDYWSTDEVIVGKTCTITGSLRSLMNDGLTEDFQVFVTVSYSDFDITIFDGPGLIVLHETVDYAGSGAWSVENVQEKKLETDSRIDLSFLILPLVVVGVVFLLIVLGIIFFVVSRSRKKLFD